MVKHQRNTTQLPSETFLPKQTKNSSHDVKTGEQWELKTTHNTLVSIVWLICVPIHLAKP